MLGVGHDSLVHKRYALSAWKSMKACMRREIILVYRHSFVYLFRIAQVCSRFHTHNKCQAHAPGSMHPKWGLAACFFAAPSPCLSPLAHM